MTLVEAAAVRVTWSRLGRSDPLCLLGGNCSVRRVLAKGAVHYYPSAAGLQETMVIFPVLAAGEIPELPTSEWQ